MVDELRFEWDSTKERLNQLKHGIAFEEAQTVFADDQAIVLSDPAHSATGILRPFSPLRLTGRESAQGAKQRPPPRHEFSKQPPASHSLRFLQPVTAKALFV